ncbi:(E3-independent) E2 ubiquitin-conjugating enzyme [Drosophila grimshawi]|uniref:GH13926 n=1 Tax=Drosophila grimshawi TaxID=7222 RepID=B4JTN2_DROGR|nr:(E3-independent) E2 ubiquitin-conjugating enzyme [Drosophila grimshawi]XP_043070986.1 (E3-independent) E2 ubiquitin-conjugating enzyme [Drosophila grimshawi]EDV91461.1 GH13926 [Drosophila grimshawi]
MLSQVAGAANDGGTPSEAAATPQTVADPKVVASTPPAAAVAAAAEKASSPTGNRRTGGGASVSRSSDNRELQFFFEDEIFRIDHKGRVRFGVVTGTAECYSSDDEEEEVTEVLGKGEVRVAFYPDAKEVVRTEKSIGLVDRTLMPGDVVRRRLPGQKHMSGQAGYVRDVNVRADVKVLGTKHVIRNVPSERMKPISEWACDVPVCLGNWIGYTIGVEESAVLKSNHGTLLEITSNDYHKFKDAGGVVDGDVFTPSVYYPNNLVIGRLPPLNRVTNLTPDLPLPTNRKRYSLYTVQSVKTTSITVAWTFKATPQFDSGSDLDPLKQPKSCIKGDDLANVKRLNIYESYMLQIHDRFYLKYSQCDKLIKYSDWEQEQAKLFKIIYERQKSEENKKCEQPKQNLSRGGIETPSPSGPSSSRNVHMYKMRRHSGKSSNQRLNRSLGESDASNVTVKVCAAKNANESWEPVNDDADEETSQEAQEAAGASELAVSTTEKKVVKSPINSFASHSRNFNRRLGKKKGIPCKKGALLRKQSNPKDGDTMVVETLVVYSSLTVVWQDGSVEAGIPSTELYPIHHLDNHEFFPGDFVSKANDYSPSQMDYGVIQSVDHDERIAKVKWFNIYGNMNHPVPSCKEVEELSVYDLKDHADYQYRPGTLVIRVSNFTGEDIHSTAGQVIDNFPDGRVRVWWTKGHITMCYPQDLFEIHQSDTQDPYESDDSENSWETQSENSQTMDKSFSVVSMDAEQYIILGIDRAKEAIQRLEKVFYVLPEQRKFDVLKDLLAVYNNCHCLDRFLNTSYFHEDYFNGILRRKTPTESVSSSGQQTAVDAPPAAVEVHLLVGSCSPIGCTGLKLELPVSGQITSTSTPNKRKSSTHVDEVQCKKYSSSERINVDDPAEQAALLDNVVLSKSETELSYSDLVSKYRSEYADMIRAARVSIAMAFDKCKNTKNDSGVHSRGENSSDDFKDTDSNFIKFSVTDVELVPNLDGDVCEVFCFLLKERMEKCREGIMETFAKNKIDGKDVDEEHISDVDVNVNAFEDKDISDQDMPPAYNKDPDPVMDESLNLNALSESLPPLENPTACLSPPVNKVNTESNSCFEVVPNATKSHHFIGNIIHPNNKAQYQRAIQREYTMLYASLPPGVTVRAYEDRMDLISVMMVGPKRTPYENALFFFDFQMGSDYPKSPPKCHYISYCTERLNPNLYEEGKVCVSLLGTWTGRDTEVWSPHSTMLQVLVSIQGLILVDEPYFNEAGYEKQRGTQLGNENSRVYNEMAIIKMAHSTVKQLQNPPQIFRKELIEHFKEFGGELLGRMQAWSEYSAHAQSLKITSINDMPKDYKTPCEMPEFPLLPCSRGFCIAVKGVLATLQNELSALERKDENNLDTVVPVPVVATAPRAAPEDV